MITEKEQTFEEKQEALEKIARRLEEGNVPLEEMIRLFETGEALYRDCLSTLDRYEQRIEALSKESEQ